MNKLLILLLAGFIAFFTVSCSEDDDSGTDSNNDTKAWVGNWLSEGSNVAVLLSGTFSIDSIYVEMKDDGTIALDQHVAGVGWSSNSGTYSVTESSSGTIHTIAISYSSPAFDQEGIIEITDGTPDMMQLEVVQTNPTIGAVPPTVSGGFGSTNAGALGTINVQKYVRVD
ncbi:MAG: hypothetical protein KDF60_13080 [Calditrichaeota bacterium]|nr:hypothetical protein [Calditrichota bacterium]